MKSIYAVLLALVLMALPIGLSAQTTSSGDIAGTLTDPQGAVVPNASISVTNDATGQVTNVTSGASGTFRASSLAPGSYTLSTDVQGFGVTKKRAVVTVGQVTTVVLSLSSVQRTETVDITADTPLVQTENGNISSSYDSRQIELMPNGGGDQTYIAQTSPGVNINTSSGGGYGNFSAFGLPATSNLFTINGNDNMDPFLNLNNSGATNLTLGANELAEVSVVNNGYDVNFGRQAGTQVNSVTKSGTNAFHGNAIYYWNGRAMNANNWYNKHADTNPISSDPNGGQTITPRGFVNANQWADSIGGPIRKDKTFFFVDNEGLRVIIPVAAQVFVPTSAFANYVLGTSLPANGASGQVPYYTNLFKQFANAPGSANSRAVAKGDGDPAYGCGDFAGMVPQFGVTDASGNLAPGSNPCANTYHTNLNNFASEWLLAARVDHQLTANDKMYLRYHQDKGVQPTYTDPLSPIFNTLSPQPSYDGQLNETHTFGTKAVNQFILSGAYYRAIFSSPTEKQALALYPTTTQFFDGDFASLGGINYVFPQGRNVTQYQIVDDYNYNLSNHTVKVGVNYRRNDVTDYSPSVYTTGRNIVFSITDFTQGINDYLQVRYPQSPKAPLALWSGGIYAQDDWRVSNTFKLNLGLRVDHNSNPVCQSNCFNTLRGPFNSLGLTGTEAYNSVIKTNLHQAYPGINQVLFQPRIGFAWQPLGSSKGLVVRGGFGIFNDLLPATIADDALTSAPNVARFTTGAAVDGTLFDFAQNTPGSALAVLNNSNAAFRAQFANGGTFQSISAAVAPATFAAPSYTALPRKLKTPQFQEYNLTVERTIGSRNSVSLGYVGNHGLYIPQNDGWVNAQCRSNCGPLATTFTNVRAKSFGNVTQITSSGYSHYNGVTAIFARKFTAGLQAQVSYTYSHATDTVSNGGILPYSSNDSLLSQFSPFSQALNYGNADYDVRHAVNANYVYVLPYKFSNRLVNTVAGGWSVAGTVFYHTGYPFTVTDTSAATKLLRNATGTTLPANITGPVDFFSCTSGPAISVNAPGCLNASSFTSVSVTGIPAFYSNQRRNQFRGPGYFNTDLSLSKAFALTERFHLVVGANAYNILNHPNFGNPTGALSGSTGAFFTTVNPPTSALGSGLGGDAASRSIQLEAKVTF